MISQILGWVTFVAGAGGSVLLAAWLIQVGRRPWSWQQPLRAPKPEGDITFLRSSDYVGPI